MTCGNLRRFGFQRDCRQSGHVDGGSRIRRGIRLVVERFGAQSRWQVIGQIKRFTGYHVAFGVTCVLGATCYGGFVIFVNRFRCVHSEGGLMLSIDGTT